MTESVALELELPTAEATASFQAPATIEARAMIADPADPAMELLGEAVREAIRAKDIGIMRELLTMQREVRADNAKRAYNRDLGLLQADLPVIVKHGKIKVGNDVRSTYALWSDIHDAIRIPMANHGFALSFRTGIVEGKPSITGVLSHRDGHSEETSLPLPLDSSGSKNNVQAMGSSISYGKRYVASALLNLASRDGFEGDDDAQTAGAGDTITRAEVEDLRILAKEVGADLAKFCTVFKIASLEQLPANQFDYAKQRLEAKRQAK